ncbi:hypothetical protein [Aeromonas media]|uniref:hypothetical protein n=1 Tax=Aeromonas media TaxID=651 RepID=UPI0029537B61|nr:hypothetical protein [Aeromonas media]WOQ15187.1 hypothetical protein R2X36_10220 [Aeromonas media]
MFIFELSIALKIPVFEIKEWPIEIIDQYRAMNIIRPFTERAKSIRDGFMIELLRNQNVTKKKDYKTMDELLPYLGNGLPEFMENEHVKMAIKQLGFATNIGHRFMIEDTLRLMKEEIDIELSKPSSERDMYVIKRLSGLIRDTQIDNEQ